MNRTSVDPSRDTRRAGAGIAASLGGAMDWMRRRRGAIGLFALCAVVVWAKPMGLLLWARIRILTSIPKTAIAEDGPVAQRTPETPKEFETGLPAQTEMTIDPFRVDSTVFPAIVPATKTPISAPDTTENPAVGEVERSDELERAQRAAERLRLGSAGAGLSIALIDGRTYRIGDSIAGADGIVFTLVEVRDHSAVVASGGENFEIRLHK